MDHRRAGQKSRFGSDITQPCYLLEIPGTEAENPGAVSGEIFETYQAGGADLKFANFVRYNDSRPPSNLTRRAFFVFILFPRPFRHAESSNRRALGSLFERVFFLA